MWTSTIRSAVARRITSAEIRAHPCNDPSGKRSRLVREGQTRLTFIGPIISNPEPVAQPCAPHDVIQTSLYRDGRAIHSMYIFQVKAPA